MCKNSLNKMKQRYPKLIKINQIICLYILLSILVYIIMQNGLKIKTQSFKIGKGLPFKIISMTF